MILIDRAIWPNHGTTFAHMVSDTSVAELHEFAARLGAPRRAFDRDHYDIPVWLVDDAIRLGARQVGAREIVGALRAAGLRRPRFSSS